MFVKSVVLRWIDQGRNIAHKSALAKSNTTRITRTNKKEVGIGKANWLNSWEELANAVATPNV